MGHPESCRLGNCRVGLEVAVVADVDAAGVGGEIPGAEEEDGDAGKGPEEKLHGECGRDVLMSLAVCAGRPREEESAEEGDTGGEGEAEKRGGEAILQAGAGDKEGADRDPVESHDAEEEGSSAGEVEKHESAPSNRLIAIVCRTGQFRFVPSQVPKGRDLGHPFSCRLRKSTPINSRSPSASLRAGFRRALRFAASLLRMTDFGRRSCAAKADYIAATKAGRAELALPSRSCVIRALIPVYMEAARKAL